LCIANLIAVGFIVMANPIVSVWLGEDYVISRWIVVLLGVDLFISITHGAAGEFIQVLGLFQDDRNMSIVAMVLNLATSLTMVNVIGVAGVLLGTVIAQIYYWIARAHIVFRQYFRRNCGKYVFHVIKYVLVTAFDIVFIMGLRQIGGIKEHTMIGLLAGCMLCVIVCGIVIGLTGFYTDEGKYAVGLVKRYFVRIGNRLKNGTSH
jgi:O-antigen/teichoic acid export membrane protein